MQLYRKKIIDLLQVVPIKLTKAENVKLKNAF